MVFYPDVMVTCDQEDRNHKIMKQSPIFIVEVSCYRQLGIMSVGTNLLFSGGGATLWE